MTGPMKRDEVLRQKLDVLRGEHRDLDTTILEIEAGPVPDTLEIRRLKKRKLSLKDEIARLEDEITPDIIA